MAWRESKRWEAVSLTCRELEEKGVLSQRGKLLYAMDAAFDDMAAEMKLQMQQVLSEMQGQVKDGDGVNVFNALIDRGCQQVERWGALRKTHTVRRAATAAVRADESLRQVFEQLREHADCEVKMHLRKEAEKKFSLESRVSEGSWTHIINNAEIFRNCMQARANGERKRLYLMKC